MTMMKHGIDNGKIIWRKPMPKHFKCRHNALKFMWGVSIYWCNLCGSLYKNGRWIYPKRMEIKQCLK
jgi:hypothetical protein